MKQGYNARLDESLGAKNGKKSQSFKARRDESKAMSKKYMDTLMAEITQWSALHILKQEVLNNT